MAKISEIRKVSAEHVTEPVVWLLAKTSVTPSVISVVGFCLAVVAAVLVAIGQVIAGGVVVLVAGFFDMLDGALARRTNQTTLFGGVLDSTLDRFSEAVILLGVLTIFLFTEERNFFTLLSREWAVLLVGVVLFSSLLVSYIRARAEASGMECKVGIFTRSERVVVLALGLLLSQVDSALVITLAIIGVLSLVAAGQRLLCVWQQTRVR